MFARVQLIDFGLLGSFQPQHYAQLTGRRPLLKLVLQCIYSSETQINISVLILHYNRVDHSSNLSCNVFIHQKLRSTFQCLYYTEQPPLQTDHMCLCVRNSDRHFSAYTTRSRPLLRLIICVYVRETQIDISVLIIHYNRVDHFLNWSYLFVCEKLRSTFQCAHYFEWAAESLSNLYSIRYEGLKQKFQWIFQCVCYFKWATLKLACMFTYEGPSVSEYIYICFV